MTFSLLASPFLIPNSGKLSQPNLLAWCWLIRHVTGEKSSVSYSLTDAPRTLVLKGGRLRGAFSVKSIMALYMLPILLLFSVISIAIYSFKLQQSVTRAPRLGTVVNDTSTAQTYCPAIASEGDRETPRISAIIPAYNEAENIEKCVKAVLNSTRLPASEMEVWVVDDQSTDETLAIAESIQKEFNDSALKILAGKPRPIKEKWVGKNWACAQAAERAKGEFLLFIDADVILKTGVIETVIQEAQQKQIDLLSLFPALICGCFAEWLVQPLMFNHCQVVNDYQLVNDPQSTIASASGPFMLFRRSAYEQLGGHRRVADQIVEDVELARLVKATGMKLQFMPGAGFVSVRMYQSWKALWEGWTKNLYLAMQRKWWLAFSLALIMVIIYTIPWLGLAAVLGKSVIGSWSRLDYLSVGLAGAAIALQYDLRRIGAKYCQSPKRYWWLSGVGGILIAAIVIASMVKTETGWGWTWRGRQLK